MYSFDDIRKISYYQSGNDFSGSEGLFNYKIIPKNDNLEVYVWYGKFCYKKSAPVSQGTYELSSDGLEEVREYLNNEFKEFMKKESKL